MYLGRKDEARRDQLLALQVLITGYSLALHQHQLGQQDLVVIAELEDYVRRHSGADGLPGINHILATSRTEDEAWSRFWTLFHQFRELKGHTA